MREFDQQPTDQSAFLGVEERLPGSHPLRRVRQLVDGVLSDMGGDLVPLYPMPGRAPIPPEQVLCASLLQALFSIRTERQLCEQIEFNLLYRWFVRLSPSDAPWDHCTFFESREQLLRETVSRRFFHRVKALAEWQALLSDESLAVDGFLWESWASHKVMQRREGAEPQRDALRNWPSNSCTPIRHDINQPLNASPKPRLVREEVAEENWIAPGPNPSIAVPEGRGGAPDELLLKNYKRPVTAGNEKTNGATFIARKPHFDDVVGLRHDGKGFTIEAYVDALNGAAPARMLLSERFPDVDAHCMRVASLSYRLSIWMGYDEGVARITRAVGLLHDVGKLCLTRAVLEHNGPLSPAAWIEVRRHALVGAKALSASTSADLLLIGRLVGCHHERVDGGGYPDGLCGEQIPVLAQIVAIADAYDALASKRAYKAALAHEQVMTVLADEAESGKWDAALFAGLEGYFADNPDLAMPAWLEADRLTRHGDH